jgi:hypothetical protein
MTHADLEQIIDDLAYRYKQAPLGSGVEPQHPPHHPGRLRIRHRDIHQPAKHLPLADTIENGSQHARERRQRVSWRAAEQAPSRKCSIRALRITSNTSAGGLSEFDGITRLICSRTFHEDRPVCRREVGRHLQRLVG